VSALDSKYKNAPLVFGHRGASYDAPENTLAAFRLAEAMGADGIELDTSLSRDNLPVVIHDLTLDKTTNGTGLVRSFDVKHLKALDASGKFAAQYKGEAIPTLDEVLAAVGKKMFINIELKSVTLRTDGLERAVADVIRRNQAEQRVIVSSFNPFALRRFRALTPDIPLGFLYSPHEPVYLRWLMIGLRHEARHPQHTMIDTAYMRWAKRNHYRVNTWTVDDPARIVQLRDLGVDGIITNRPGVALQALGRS
jgi:glycerophosphoryl diester phosphodiesterase